MLRIPEGHLHQEGGLRISHDKSRERSTSAKTKPAGKSKKQCTFFKAGTCKFGDSCRDLHGGGGQRSASPKRKPKGRPKGKPAAAAVAISVPAGSTVYILKVHVPTPVPGSVALAASTDYGPSDNCRSWLLDTGCKFDLTTRASVPPYLQNSIMKATVPITLSTANDLVNGDMVVRQQIMEFNEVAEPYILDSTPDVLSIGRRCVEDGYAFHWEPYSLAPTMITADGTVVTLISRDCCPYLDGPEPNYVNPAVAAPQEVGHSVTWDSDFVSGEPSVPAGARSSKRKTANSVSAGSRFNESYGDPSASAGGPIRDRWSDLADEDDEYEGMTAISFTDAGEDCSSCGEHEAGEPGTT